MPDGQKLRVAAAPVLAARGTPQNEHGRHEKALQTSASDVTLV